MFLMVAFLALAGCSGKGPDLVDPNSQNRTETAMILLEQGGNFDLARFDELTGALATGEYAAVNGGNPPGPANALYVYDDAIYLHQLDSGKIDVLDLRTRKQTAAIYGFPFSVGGTLTNMAFSNASQGWVVANGSLNLYHIDLRNNVIADTIPLPANPTHVGANVRNVFVGMQESDGSGTLAIFRSNPAGAFTIEKTLRFPSPVIYSMSTEDSLQFIVLTSGGPGEIKPKLFYIGMGTLDVISQYELEAPPLDAYIGKQPTFAAHTRDEFLYISLPNAVMQVNTLNQFSNEWLTGNHPVVGADYFSGLFYAYDPGANVIRRRDIDGNELPDISVPGPVRDIEFVASSRVQ
jgi:hypothetical protein